MEKLRCEGENHKWNKTDEQFAAQAVEWHKNDTAPEGQVYVSKYVIHYWDVAECFYCGKKKLLSSVIDRDIGHPISDEEFTWLTLFITQLNREEGYIGEKKQLINDSLDQMHWKHFPYVTMHNPRDNHFSISYKDDTFLRYEWDFNDALAMFHAMNRRAQEYLAPEETRALDEQLERLEALKTRYRTLMELATQAGLDAGLERELEELSEEFKKLSEDLKDFV